MADSVDDDDFGDLYADLDDQVNARVATFNSLPNCGSALEEDHGGSGVKNEESLCEDGQSSGEGRIMGFNQARDLIIEAASEKNNESEDDLRIVLNEEGRSKLMGDAWRAYIGNGVQEEVEDEKDNLVIVVGSDGLADDCRRGELVAAQGMPWEDRERKHNFSGWHAGFSYFARDGWDHHMMQYLRDSSYCKSGLPVVGQSGSCFSLPRNRIIFDISIEAFEQKPWKQPGMNITDYFNFGLDEDSWKGYWLSMERLRHDAAMPMQRPCSLRHQVPTGEISKDSAQILHVEHLPVSMQKVDKGPKGLEMMKGRAIQVESGIGERLPSIDIRRPRQRDEDVVIQIPVENGSDDANNALVESDHLTPKSTTSSPAKYETLSEGMLSADRMERGSPSIGSHSIEVESCDEKNLQEFRCELDYNKSGEVTPRPSSLGQDAASPVNQANTILSYSDSDTNHETSKESDHTVKFDNLIRSTCSSSAQEPFKSDYYFSDDFRSSDNEPVEADEKFDDKSLYVDYRNFSRNKLKSEAMLRISSDDEECSTEFHQQIDVNSKRISCQTKERKQNKGVDIPKDLTSKEETESRIYYNSRDDERKHTKERYSRSFYRRGKSSSYHRRRFVGSDSLVDRKVAEEYNEVNHDNFHLHERSCDLSKLRNHVRGDYSLVARGVVEQDNDIKHDKFHLYGRCHDYPKIRKGARDDYQERIPSSEILYQETASCSYRKDQSRTWKEVRHDIYATEKSSKAYKFEVMKRKIPYINEVNSDEFVRQVPVRAVCHLEKRKRRKMYYGRLCTEDMSNVIDKPGATIPKHLDWPLASNMCVPQTGAGRSHRHLCSPNNISMVSWKSKEHYEDCRRHLNSIETQMQNKHRHYSPRNNDLNNYSSYKNRFDFECHRYITLERSLYHGNLHKQIRYGCASSPWSHKDEDQCRRRDARVSLSSLYRSLPYERDYRHENSHVDYGSESDRNLSDLDILSYHREKNYGRNANYASTEDKRFDSHNFEKSSHNLNISGRDDDCIMHFNGVERKYTKRRNHGAAESRRNDRHIGYPIHIEDAPEFPYLLGRRQMRPITLEENVREFKLEIPDDHMSKKLQVKHQGPQDNEDDEIEEGQLIEEPDDRDLGLVRKSEGCEKEVTSMAIRANRMDSLQKTNIQSKYFLPNQSFGGQDNTRLLETLARMKKRRERFKEPLAPRQGTDNILNMQMDTSTTVDEVKPQRPARKRRWVCS